MDLTTEKWRLDPAITESRSHGNDLFSKVNEILYGVVWTNSMVPIGLVMPKKNGPVQPAKRMYENYAVLAQTTWFFSLRSSTVYSVFAEGSGSRWQLSPLTVAALPV